MDILLNTDGDLHVTSDGDIALGNSVAQKIRIRLLWFESEWRWDVDEGMPYRNNLLVKNPDTGYFESVVRERIFEIDEVTEVKEVTVAFDRQARDAVIKFIAMTDAETIKEEVKVRCQIMG